MKQVKKHYLYEFSIQKMVGDRHKNKFSTTKFSFILQYFLGIYLMLYIDKDGFKNKLIGFFDKYCEPDLKRIFEKYRKGTDDGIDNAVNKAFDVKRVRRAYNSLGTFFQ